MKKFLINKYYDLLMILEDFFANISDNINDHRISLDEKYWDDVFENERDLNCK